MVEVATSLLNVEEENIIQTLYDLETAKTDYFHIDVMDGKFVEDNTVEKMRKYTEYIKQISNLPIDVHLMVKDVKDHVNSYLAMDVNCISFQVEGCKNENEVREIIKYIKENNCRVGIAINPKTTLEKVYELIPYVHKVIIMTVEAGKGGQVLIPEMVNKIFELNKYIYENGYDVDIEVDGGVNGMNAKDLTDAGANIIVAGSYIINLNNYAEAIKILKQ